MPRSARPRNRDSALAQVLALGVLPLLASALGCAPGAPEVADEPPPPSIAEGPATEIQAPGILADVEALSVDAMGGRGTGTEGEEKAAAYLVQRFEEIGLAPVGGSYRQDFELVGTKSRPGASLTLTGPEGAIPVTDGENVAFWSSVQKEVVDLEQVPLLFVGYGVEAPEFGWDDFEGQDVRGKVLLFLNDDPPVAEDGVDLFGGPARTYYGRWTYKFEQAMRHGAVGALVIHTTPSASYGWSVIQYSGAEEHFALDLPGTGYRVDLLGWLREDVAAQIAAAMGTDLEGLFERAKSREFEPVDTGFLVSAHVETDIRRTETANVVAMLEGSDPELAEEVLVFSAHYDHLGTNPELEGDPIFNGAWDNAAGTASIVALAEAFAATEPRPRRSVLFLACAAEEKGSLGSQWFVARPPFERSRLVGNFNVDMPQIFGVTHDIAAIGHETNSLGAALREVAGTLGITVTGDPNPNAGSFYRSDQVNFAKAGVPALFVLPGTDYVAPLSFSVEEYRDEHYHQPADEVNEKWDLSGAERDMRVLYQTALRVANADAMPRWVAGNEFEEAWRELHGEVD
ncbi:MAG TPA: M28 family peptidase [Thermoanaerobaculia bacterium]|nr:M28 family peptidase [Thermoanaerobaculia bacterium]